MTIGRKERQRVYWEWRLVGTYVVVRLLGMLIKVRIADGRRLLR